VKLSFSLLPPCVAVGIAFATLAEPARAQQADGTAFELTLAAGVAGNDALENSHSAILVMPTITLDRPNRPFLQVRIPIVRWPKRKDPVWLSRPRPLANDPEPLPDFRLADLDIGPTWGGFPELALTWPSDSRWTPEVFVGAGFLADEGQATRLGTQTLRTGSVTSPALTYGLGLGYGLTDRFGLRLEARGFTAFPDNLTIEATADNGRTSLYTVEGGRMQLSMVTAGLTVRF
jgi:hypothetical protein